MKVYRVENENQFGPFHSRRLHSIKLSNACRKIPTPYADSKLRHQIYKFDDYKFAFYSFDDVFKYFNWDELLGLGNFGFRVAEYEIDDSAVILGECQLVFKAELAKLCEYLELI